MKLVIQWCNINQGFLSAVLSLIAVLAAVGIPAFIAHRQNKIALFEQRYNTYQIIYFFFHAWNASLLFSGNNSDSTNSLIAIKNLFLSFFVQFTASENSELSVKDVGRIDADLAYSQYAKIVLNLGKLPQLFCLKVADRGYLRKIESGYITISALESLQNKDLQQTIALNKPRIREFLELLKTYESFLKLLEKQVTVGNS